MLAAPSVMLDTDCFLLQGLEFALEVEVGTAWDMIANTTGLTDLFVAQDTFSEEGPCLRVAPILGTGLTTF